MNPNPPSSSSVLVFRSEAGIPLVSRLCLSVTGCPMLLRASSPVLPGRELGQRFVAELRMPFGGGPEDKVLGARRLVCAHIPDHHTYLLLSRLLRTDSKGRRSCRQGTRAPGAFLGKHLCTTPCSFPSCGGSLWAHLPHHSVYVFPRCGPV